ncbi:hypothetical protein O7599_19050 [Streptomyces sp. WMMC500]|uniref:hypothetical protein n=1 Tax=Streptomyces sp. WMMC500 TaxID=3015154 RepID=UPI00248D1559|nr:hypothetical protein [Streptomyces sp. WMMC500]WBB57784.1 hypothetical protein O7599_19050 [Streptomyces sp. WMMC500]
MERADGHLWVSAPGLGVWDPFMLRVTRSSGTEYPDGAEYDEIIHMDVHVHWSFWWEPGEGRAMLDRAVGRLLRQGWREAYPRPDPA